MHKWANNNSEISKIWALYEFSSKTANMLTDKESNLAIKFFRVKINLLNHHK